MGHLAEYSPLMAPDAYCSDCGKLMDKKVELNSHGHALKVIYTCINEETGCSYFVEQDQRLSAMQQLIR